MGRGGRGAGTWGSDRHAHCQDAVGGGRARKRQPNGRRHPPGNRPTPHRPAPHCTAPSRPRPAPPKVDCDVGRPKVNYRETVRRRGEFNYLHKKQSGGSGGGARRRLPHVHLADTCQPPRRGSQRVPLRALCVGGAGSPARQRRGRMDSPGCIGLPCGDHHHNPDRIPCNTPPTQASLRA